MDPVKQVEELTAQVKTLTAQVESLTKDVATKDALIAQKNSDIVGIRKKYKLTTELTEDERSQLSAEELAEREAMDEIVLNQEAQAKQDAELKARELSDRKTRLVAKYVNDPEMQKKVLENFDKIKGSELAWTDTEVESFLGTAVNMLGSDRPDPVASALNGAGGKAPDAGNYKEGEFAGTDKGKSLAGELGLTYVAAENGGQATT